jgi:hypothetical protein
VVVAAAAALTLARCRAALARLPHDEESMTRLATEVRPMLERGWSIPPKG